jgi:lipopolysaccharide export system protein LptA
VAKARHATVIRLLRGSLAAALGVFVALIGLYLFGRQGKPEPEVVEQSDPADGDFAVRGEGFEFALTKGDKVVFEIRGREQRSDREGKAFLEDVLIAMERGDGLYRVEGKSAVYDQGTQEARLEGDVVIRGPRGMQVETDWLELAEEGNRIRARDGVRFASGRDLRGRADVLEADLDGRTLSLQGSIAVASAADAKVPFRLLTEELVFREEAASAVARGGVELESGESRLRGQRLHLFFDQETRALELARLLSSVEGELATTARDESASVAAASLAPRSPGGGGKSRPLTLRATSLEVRFDPVSGQTLEVDLRGLERRPARVVQAQPDRSIATLTTVSLVGTFENGTLSRADLHGPVWLTQGGLRSRRGAERQVKAANGEARFDPAEGSLDGVTLVGEVSLRDADASATGDRAYVDLRRETFEILGAPAHLEHPRGTLDAPHAVYRRDPGILEADGGVAAVLREGGEALAPGLLAPGGSSDQPLRVEAREAIWQSEPSNVRFLGDVRAWQGSNTIFAQQLRGEPDRGWMAASGGVRTLWLEAPADGETAAAPPPGSKVAAADAARAAPGDSGDDRDSEEDGDPERPAGPLEITSAEMTYSESESRLIYTGAVKAVQDWTSLTCDRMTVVLLPGGGTDEIHCDTAVTIVDSRNGRTLQGDRAVYYPKVPEVEVFGDPLTMADAAGNKVEGGRHFVYDLESGSSRLTAKAGAAP